MNRIQKLRSGIRIIRYRVRVGRRVKKREKLEAEIQKVFRKWLRMYNQMDGVMGNHFSLATAREFQNHDPELVEEFSKMLLDKVVSHHIYDLDYRY